MHAIQRDDMRNIYCSAHENIFDYLNSSSIHCIATMAIINDNLEVFKRAVALDGRDVNTLDDHGNAPLHIAAYLNRKNIVEWLLTQEELNINATNPRGMTALFVSIKKKHLEIVNLLVNAGADVNIRTNELDSPLIIAAQKKCVSAAKLFIENGADLDSENIYGKKPLDSAIDSLSYEIFYMLLFYGADVNNVSEYGQTVFCSALRQFSEDIITTLVDYVCDLNDPDVKDSYLFLTLLCFNEERFIKHLVLNGARFNPYEFWVGLTKARSLDIFKLLWESHNILEMDFSPGEISNAFSYLILNIRQKDLRESVIEYVIYSSSEEILQHLLSVSERYAILWNFILDALTIPIKMEKILEYCYIFLVNSIQIYDVDVVTVYGKFGFGTLYEILLYMDIKIERWERNFDQQYNSLTYLIPELMLSVNNGKMFKDISGRYFFNIVRLPQVTRIFSTMIDDLLELLRRTTCFPFKKAHSMKTSFERVLKKIEKEININLSGHFLQVPSLKELSRNACRDMVLSEYYAKNSCQFYTIVYHLPIPLIIKEIIALKRPIYHL